MNFFPYGFSKEEIYKNLVDVEDFIYVGIFLLPLFFGTVIVRLVHHCVFGSKSEENSEATSLSPLLTKSARTSARVMSLLHLILFLNGVSHFFHVGWLVDIFWYPMWISAWSIKVYTETYLVIISLFSISRYFVHFSLARASVELSERAVSSGIKWISGLMVLKDFILFIWLIVVLEMGSLVTTKRILDYFYGFYWSYHLLLFMATFMQIRVLLGSTKYDVQPSYLEKMIYLQTLIIGVVKAVLIGIFIVFLINGVNDTVVFFIFFIVDVFFVPIVTQFSEIWYKPKRVESVKIEVNEDTRRVSTPPSNIEMVPIETCQGEVAG